MAGKKAANEDVTPFPSVPAVPFPTAPTGKELMENPGKYADTAFDPTLRLIAPGTVELFSPHIGARVYQHGWFQWFRDDWQGAMAWMSSQYNVDLDISKCSDSQLRRMGYAIDPPKKTIPPPPFSR